MKKIKHLIIMGIMVLLAMPTFAQTTSKSIFKAYKSYTSESLMLTVPAFGFKLIPKEDMPEGLHDLIKQAQSVSVFVSESTSDRVYRSMMADFDTLFKKRNSKPLVSVKSDGDLVNIHFLPATKKHKGEFVILVRSEDDELIGVVVKGKFNELDSKKLAKSIKQDGFSLNM